MTVRILGIGELGATAEPGSSLKTFALGSCVALLMLDPVSHCVGMDHIALPDSAISPARARAYPGHFADTGLPALLAAMQAAGASADVRRYIVKMVGGASIMDPNNTFNIGLRNIAAIQSTLVKYGMSCRAADVGGRITRTVCLEVDTGAAHVYSPALPPWEI